MTVKKKPSIIHRPAEVTSGITGMATGIAALLGAGTETVAIVGTAAGILPTVVTYLVSHGGIAGAIRLITRGK